MTDWDDRTYYDRLTQRRPPSPDYNRFYNDTHHRASEMSCGPDHCLVDLHPEFFDDAIDDEPQEFTATPDNERWFYGKPARGRIRSGRPPAQ